MTHISLTQEHPKSMQPTVAKILTRIRVKGRGWVFTYADFADLGGRQTIDWALHSLAGKGTIRRVMRGAYDYPRTGSLIKEVLPNVTASSVPIGRLLLRESCSSPRAPFRWSVRQNRTRSQSVR